MCVPSYIIIILSSFFCHLIGFDFNHIEEHARRILHTHQFNMIT